MCMIFTSILNQYKKWRPTVATRNIIYAFVSRQRRMSFGRALPDQTIYIIRSIRDQSPFYIGPKHNLLANYFYVLSHIFYARSRGWVPVVDQMNYPVYNVLPDEKNGTWNPWEYFWQQPGGISLEDAYHSKHVVLSKQSWFGQWDMGYAVSHYTDSQMIAQFHEISELVPLNSATQEHIEKERKRLFPLQGKILGVSFRYGGHAKSNPHHGQGHPIQPEVDELLEIIKQCVDLWRMDYIFLASDEKQAVAQFQKEFGTRLLVLERERLDSNVRYTLKNPDLMYQTERIYYTSLDYLTEMELLSWCNALVGSVTSGLRYAVVRNGGRYEQVKILDYGLFSDQRKIRNQGGT